MRESITVIPCIGCARPLKFVSVGSGKDPEAPELGQFVNSQDIWFGVIAVGQGGVAIVGCHTACINNCPGFAGTMPMPKTEPPCHHRRVTTSAGDFCEDCGAEV